jgi:hypothetical protein
MFVYGEHFTPTTRIQPRPNTPCTQHGVSRSKIADFPSRALAYATKYNYTTIVDLAAPLTIAFELEPMRATLSDPRALSAWVRPLIIVLDRLRGELTLFPQVQYKMTYLERLTNILNRAPPTASMDPPGWARAPNECQNWAQYASQVESLIPAPVLTFLSSNTGDSAEALFRGHTLACMRPECNCHLRANEWKGDIIGLLKHTPALSTFLGR